MSSRQGGKLKPLKVGSPLCFYFRILTYRLTQAPKKEKQEETEEEKAFKDKQKADAAAAKLAREKGSFLPRLLILLIV
jgi:Translation machinery associated TMA7